MANSQHPLAEDDEPTIVDTPVHAPRVPGDRLAGDVTWSDVTRVPSEADLRHAQNGLHGKALVLVLFDRMLVLCWDGGPTLEELVSDCGGGSRGGGFDVDDVVCDVLTPEKLDGLYVADMRPVDDGPGDWPGSREWILRIENFVKATSEQWAAHCLGEYPWEPLQ